MLFLSCYSLIKHNCDGGCQGQGFCPWCHNFYCAKENEIKNITRRTVVWYILTKNIIGDIKCKWIFFIHRKAIKKIIDDCCDELERKVKK
jgi:hypothetical protein